MHQEEPRPEPVPRRDGGAPPPGPAETRRHPVPGVTHEPEPDAENLIPIDDQPGTL